MVIDIIPLRIDTIHLLTIISRSMAIDIILRHTGTIRLPRITIGSCSSDWQPMEICEAISVHVLPEATEPKLQENLMFEMRSRSHTNPQ